MWRAACWLASMSLQEPPHLHHGGHSPSGRASQNHASEDTGVVRLAVGAFVVDKVERGLAGFATVVAEDGLLSRGVLRGQPLCGRAGVKEVAVRGELVACQLLQPLAAGSRSCTPENSLSPQMLV